MTNRQFTFSLAVSVALIILGAVILNQASVGLSLLALGAALGVLTVVNKAVLRDSDQVIPARAQSRHMQDSATNY